MAEHTNIEWCDATFNPWIGCTRVSPACDDCYAARSTPARTLGIAWGEGAERHRTSESYWQQPLKWNAKAARESRRIRVFCASLADVFDNQVPVQWRRDLFDLIEATPNLDWLLLTKRIGNARRLYAAAYLDSARPWPANVWLGATVVDQVEADRDIPKLLRVPAKLRFVSIEPMLGPINLREVHSDICEIDALTGDHGVLRPLRGRSDAKVHWVICGGESGPNARPMHPSWARSLRDQCWAAGVPFLFKQWGEWLPVETDAPGDGEAYAVADDGTERELSGRLAWCAFERQEFLKTGKKAAGRLLDGVTHNGFPGGAA